MTPFVGLTYSFLFGLLHGILPDEHTWPITFSYAIGSSSGWEGMKAGLFFSTAFTVQRMLLSELAYLALAPFLLKPTVNGVVFIVVGLAMSIAGYITVQRNLTPRFHLLGHHHQDIAEMETNRNIFASKHTEVIPAQRGIKPPSTWWTIIHGFIAGFGFDGLFLFVSTAVAPIMPDWRYGFLPGFFFGLGTMIILIIIGGLFGIILRGFRFLTEREIKQIGVQTAGRTLLYGGILFGMAGIAILVSLSWRVSFDPGYVLISVFMVAIAIPAFIYSLKEVLYTRKVVK